MRWHVSPVDSEMVGRLARELNLSPLVARLLALRGIEDPEAANRFLEPRLTHLHDPYRMADMRPAVERLRRAIAQQEKILIYGDYDVDGTMAVVVLLTALRSLGARVEAYIPHRLIDGYGMRVPVVEQSAAEGTRVIVSVDTGIREHEVIGRAQALGVDCIVTDHHLPEEHLPPACAVLNPRRVDCAYPEKSLAGVGVAFKLVQALLEGRMMESALHSYLKIVAIGTIADVVPLVGENRVIAHFGLARLGGLAGLREPSQAGLKALIETAGLSGQAVTANDVAFRIAPRLNAAGRMEDARDVIELLMTPDGERAGCIATRLELLNHERQRTEDEILHQITDLMARRPEMSGRYSLVFSGEGWHRGVIGIVAQRVVDRAYRPTLVVGVEDGVGVGSGRAIRGFHLLNALTSMSDLFARFGGHAQAAGFALPADRIADLEARFEESARALLRAEDLVPALRIDCELGLDDLDWDLFEAVQRLEPFGAGNPKPVFAARGARLMAPARVLKEKHLKLRVKQGDKAFDALAWRQAERSGELASGQSLDLAFTLDANVYQGVSTLQLVLRDFQSAEREADLGKSECRESEA
ncbi:MAG: single-stranded-DNA-specific exonuclease RecJ [Acidobacteria bacterium]|nr:single-stranded-DNA-specific exonuclease RecJ [Acidobacteriota bacterium]